MIEDKDLLKALKIPKFDQHEDPKNLKDTLLDAQQEEEDRIAKEEKVAAEKRKKELKDKFSEMAAKNRNFRVVKGSTSYFRSVSWAIEVF